MTKRIISHTISIAITLCLIICLLPIRGLAAAEPLTYTLEEDGTLTVRVAGDWTGELPWAAKKDSITSVFLEGSGASSLSGMFKGYERLENVYITMDTSRVKDFSEMFYGCKALKKVNANDLNMSSAEDLRDMFSNCSALTSANLSNWIFERDNICMEGIFRKCSSLVKLDLSSWKGTSHISCMKRAFMSCSSMETLKLTGLDFSGLTYASYMFFEDSKLNTKLTISHELADTSSAFTDAATEPGKSIFVRYKDDKYKSTVANLVATANAGSGVISWKIPEITADDISLSEDTVQYDGKEKTPAVTVKVMDMTLTKDTDYTLAYYDNKEASDKAYVRVTGIEDYTGAVDKYFTIAKEVNEITVSSESIQRTVSKKAKTVTFTASCKYDSLTVSTENKKIKASIDKEGKVTVNIPANYMGNININLMSTSAELYQGTTKVLPISVGPTGTTIKTIESKVSGKFKVVWNINKKVDGYQLRYSEDPEFKEYKHKSTNKVKAVKATVSKVTDGNTYYVQVRTYKLVNNEKVYSKWSKAASVVIATASLSETSAIVYKGYSKTLKVVGSDGQVKWSSSDKSIATVNSKGKVKGKKNGTCTITAKVGDYELSCQVTVKTKNGYQKLYDYIEKHGKTNSAGNKIITDSKGQYGILYNTAQNRFEFIYQKGYEGMTMIIGRDGSDSANPVYVYSDSVNFCKSSSAFATAEYVKGSKLSFVPSAYRGYDVDTFNDMANKTFNRSMTGWNKLLKKAKTNFKGIGFKKY